MRTDTLTALLLNPFLTFGEAVKECRPADPARKSWREESGGRPGRSHRVTRTPAERPAMPGSERRAPAF